MDAAAKRWGAAAALAGLLVAGCGGGGGSGGAEASGGAATSAPAGGEGAAAEAEPATVDTGAATLRSTLTGLLQEHVYLGGATTDQALNGTPEGAAAASATLDRNSQALANIFANVYGPDAGNTFLERWRQHNALYQDYATGQGLGDAAKASAARAGLERFAADFGGFVGQASGGKLPSAEVTQDLNAHVGLVTAAIDAQAAANPAAYAALRQAAQQAPAMARMLATGMAAQFPERFGGNPGDEAANLRADLTASFQEHAYLATTALGAAAAGRSADYQAASATLDANATTLADAFTRDLGADQRAPARAEFLDRWRRMTGLYGDYLRARQANDRAATTAARNGLSTVVLDNRRTDLDPNDDQGLAVLMERVTNGDLPRGDMATELSALPSGVTSTIDALVSTDPTGPRPIDQAKSAADTAYRLGTVVSGGIVSSHNEAFQP